VHFIQKLLSYQPYSLYILKTACSLVTSLCCSLCTRYPSNGWQASATTAFDTGVSSRQGVLDILSNAMSGYSCIS